jgi:hypothetical protein
MNITLKHDGQELINTDRVIRQCNGLLAYNGKSVVKIVFCHPAEQGDDVSLLIDCRALEKGGELMNEFEKDKYGVIEHENVLTAEEKAELEKELRDGNDAEHK